MATTFPKLAQYRPLERAQGQARMTRHDIICLHTMVGYLTSTDAMFKQGGWTGTESHFGVGGKWGPDKDAGLDGVIYQWQDTDFRADANLEGNRRLISIETADNAPRLARDIEPWTDKQCIAIIRLVAQLCRTYSIPAVLVPDSKPGRRGIGWHRLGIDPWRVAGGEVWSKARGKECPGDARIKQIKDVILPGVKAELAGVTIPVAIPKEDTVELKDKIKLGDSAAKELASATKDGTISVEYALLWGGARGAQLRAQLIAQGKQLAALQASLTALSGAVNAIALNSSEGVASAFSEGITKLKQELADLDLRITLGPDDDNQEAPS